MKPLQATSPDPLVTGAARATAGIVVAVWTVAGLVLIGWVAEWPALKSVYPGWATMKANTALGFVLAAGSLFWQTGRWDGRRPVPARLLAGSVVLLALLTLSQDLFPWNLQIDELMFADPVSAQAGDAPGRMSMATAIGFVPLGLALLFLSGRGTAWLPQGLGLVVMLIGSLGSLGYLYGTAGLYDFKPYHTVALHTSLLFLGLGVGILLARPEQGLMAVITSDSPGGVMARRLLPTMAVVLVGLGWLRLQGQRTGWYGQEFGLALMVILCLLILLPFTWWTARSLMLLDCQRRQTQQDLEESERRLRAILDHAPAVFSLWDPQGHYLLVNRRWENLFCRAGQDIVGQAIAEVFPGDLAQSLYRGNQTVLETGQAQEQEEVITTEKGPRTFRSLKFPLVDERGKPYAVCGIATDITERLLMEKHLRQAQKMESIGQLAGGIAHDFNNLLTVINGFSEMVMDSLPADNPALAMLAEIRKSGERAASLTRQILAFSRKQILQPRPVHLNSLVVDMQKMLCRLIGEDIRLTLDLAENLGQVQADPSQIEQVILNLAVNARDAMPRGGEISMKTSPVELNGAFKRQHPEVKPGPYVRLAVRDTGCGMDEKTMAHIFEPFFTTKEVGQGTGLGLAAVYGIIKQSDGFIYVSSALGQGTTFTIYLPRLDQVEAKPAQTGGGSFPRGTETVLLVEDNQEVRNLASLTLKAAGYSVLEASDGPEALEVNKNHAGPIHLLITDVVMPSQDGRQLADQVVAHRPAMKVLFLSGYTDDTVLRHGVMQATMPFLAKPFTPLMLAKKVRQVLDQAVQ